VNVELCPGVEVRQGQLVAATLIFRAAHDRRGGSITVV